MGSFVVAFFNCKFFAHGAVTSLSDFEFVSCGSLRF